MILRILDQLNSETFITEIKKLETNVIRIATIFKYSDDSYIDIFIKINSNNEIILTDSCNTILLFFNSDQSLKNIENVLSDEYVNDILSRYKIKFEKICFTKIISNINNISIEFFRFGEFCSIISNVLQSKGVTKS